MLLPRSAVHRIALNRLGLSQVAAAHLLGVDKRTSRHWANGERDVPKTAARFLRYFIAIGKTGEQAIQRLSPI